MILSVLASGGGQMLLLLHGGHAHTGWLLRQGQSSHMGTPVSSWQGSVKYCSDKKLQRSTRSNCVTYVCPELDFYFYTENWQKGWIKREIVHQGLGNLNFIL